MRIAETVTFGGSGLDRAAEMRGDAARIAALWRSSTARVLPVWRGKPSFAGTSDLGWVGTGLPALADGEPAIFLGMDEAGPRFAIDLSAWQPEDGEGPAQGSFFDASEQHHPGLPDGHRFVELRGVMADLSPRDAECAATAKGLIGWHRSHRFCSSCGAESAVAMAGWQRTCATCGAHHFPRTDPVVIMLITRGNRVLLGRSPGWPEGMYSCLAGFMEPGETMEAAVRREVHEEAGIRVGSVRYLASQPWPYPSSLMLGAAGEALDAAITLDPKELEDARWVSREEIARAFAGEHPEIRAPRRGAIAGFLLRNWLADRLD
ncbi:NAD(+) diphosphatase [Defluviimonas sp. WL0075]|uniref:NAD(+) diphosphatase n=1 Tax=Albidovulum sediminicola TaxID=2984331 RepID=A0ABT2YX34_9RHOB|nr:NAD(+) diphosphatase [Defluviimonas sp. WL0075]MCV2863438.1 NAD(+) diphosphatase [Defluviimonas sp. WL0075]